MAFRAGFERARRSLTEQVDKDWLGLRRAVDGKMSGQRDALSGVEDVAGGETLL